MNTTERPRPDEYAPYYETYLARIPAGADLHDLLASQREAVRSLLGGLSDERARFRYAPGKWSVKEVIGHVIDAERIFAYRALRIGRGDETPLPGFEENAYAAASGADDRPLAELLDEFDAVRASTLALVGGLSDEAARRMGTASTFPVSARAALWINAAHTAHHLAILRERYLA